MNILGINDGHGASACVLRNGTIAAACEEERFTRQKGDIGFPAHAIRAALQAAGISAGEIDLVAFGNADLSYYLQATKIYSVWEVKDFLLEMERYWKPYFQGRLQAPAASAGTDLRLETMKEYDRRAECLYDLYALKNPRDPLEKQALRRAYAAAFLSLPEDRIIFVDHHTCHAFHAYCSSPYRGDTLILTMDGFGDGVNASVSTVRGGRYESIFRTGTCNLGRIYQLITLLLRMKPGQHEYKVMGLAPYAKEHQIREPLEVFRRTLYVDGLDFRYRTPLDNHFDFFARELSPFRFDAIAGALQRFSEELIIQWAANAVAATDLHDVVFSGGVALNIKASKKIAELPEVARLFVAFAGGDESLSIGAAQHAYFQSMSLFPDPPCSAYLGPAITPDQIAALLQDPLVLRDYHVTQGVEARRIAELVAAGAVVGLMMGRMEFGPRALGHRSLIADPRSVDTVRRINETIKNRDFWMPFTPSILAERAADYLHNPKALAAPYMTLAFEASAAGREQLLAALHPYDLTARPQVVQRDSSPRYYDIIKEFEKLTGVGGVLNTSLNVHGRPIVASPADALRELLANPLVDLRCLVIEDVLLTRRTSA